MIYIVDKADNHIINRCDAWELDGDKRMVREARALGYTEFNAEITPMGDMVIWAK